MYARNARSLAEAVSSEFPGVAVSGIGEKGASQSFEIFVTPEGGSEVQVWSGTCAAALS